jgi:excisionase family DNA binding protein
MVGMASELDKVSAPMGLEGVSVVSPLEAATALGCSTRTIRELIRSGELPAFRLGSRHWSIRVSELEAFVSRREGEARYS